jgi:hypothetical protein
MLWLPLYSFIRYVAFAWLHVARPSSFISVELKISGVYRGILFNLCTLEQS